MKYISLIILFFLSFSYADTAEFQNLKTSAKEGSYLSQYMLGVAYHSQEDYKQAIHWYKKAIKSTRKTIKSQALLALSQLYKQGLGVKKNINKSIRLLKKAAEHNNVYANFLLGYYYHYGINISQNHKLALKHYEFSAKKNHADSQFYLGFLHNKLGGILQDYEKAIYWWKRAAEQKHAKAQEILGLAYYRRLAIFEYNDTYKYEKYVDQRKHLEANKTLAIANTDPNCEKVFANNK